jgi:hypothetical protein
MLLPLKSPTVVNKGESELFHFEGASFVVWWMKHEQAMERDGGH